MPKIKVIATNEGGGDDQIQLDFKFNYYLNDNSNCDDNGESFPLGSFIEFTVTINGQSKTFYLSGTGPNGGPLTGNFTGDFPIHEPIGYASIPECNICTYSTHHVPAPPHAN